MLSDPGAHVARYLKISSLRNVPEVWRASSSGDAAKRGEGSALRA
jgi:hypothetical protein